VRQRWVHSVEGAADVVGSIMSCSTCGGDAWNRDRAVDAGISTRCSSGRTTLLGQNTRGIEFLFRKNKITWAKGRGTLRAGNVVEVTSGGAPGAPPTNNRHIPGKTRHHCHRLRTIELPFLKFDEDRILSNIGALKIPRVPAHLIVIGGGIIGLELGSVWKRTRRQSHRRRAAAGDTPGHGR